MTFLKSLLIEFAGGSEALQGPFDADQYAAASRRLWEYLRDIRPFLWREGRTFPADVANLHQMFANNEVDFTMSNNDGEVDNKVRQGVLPEAARAYILDSGTIRNSHYLGIPQNSPHQAGAMVLINFLISPEAQLKKAMPETWGDGTVLSLERLPPEWRTRFERITGRERVAPRTELERRALMEPAPEVMIRIDDDFRREILERS